MGKLIASLVTDLLTALSGFNQLIEKLGFKMGLERTLESVCTGSLVLLGIILFAILGATELLSFEPLSQIVTVMISFAVQVLLGALILAIGIFIARKVRLLIIEAGMPSAAGNLASLAIMFSQSIAMALRQVGLAQDIINICLWPDAWCGSRRRSHCDWPEAARQGSPAEKFSALLDRVKK